MRLSRAKAGFALSFVALCSVTLLSRAPVSQPFPPTGTWDLVLIADKDRASRDEQQQRWSSVLQRGKLHLDRNGVYSVEWGMSVPLFSRWL